MDARIKVSTLLQKHCNKKQEIEECILKLYGYIYNQGTYTPLWGVPSKGNVDTMIVAVAATHLEMAILSESTIFVEGS